jgi:hypothetical protein
VTLAMLIALMVPVPSNSHSWYPYECCGGNDCGPVLSMSLREDGSRWIMIETLIGIVSGVFPKDFPIRPSPDGKAHACLMKGNALYGGDRPLCLFLPGDV